MENNLKGKYVGDINFTASDVQGKGVMGMMVSSMAKSQVDNVVRSGVKVTLDIDENGSWIIDMGGALAPMGITSLTSEQDEALDPQNTDYNIFRQLPIPQIGGNVEIRLEGQITNEGQGNLSIKSDNSMFTLTMEGNFVLQKIA